MNTGRGDWLGRQEQETNALGVSTYAYVGNSGRLEQATLPGNLASIYTYHPAVPAPAGTGNGDLRLSKITHRTSAGTVFDEQGYDYDQAGNISGWKQHPGVSTGTNGAQWSFGYDAADQLLGATQQGTVNGVPGGSATEQARYDYDAAGNRKVEQRAVLQGGSYATTLGSDTHNALNQVTARSGAGKMVFEGTVSEPAQVSVGGAAAQVWGLAGGQYGYRGTAPVQSGANSVPIKATDANGNLRNATAQVTVSGAAKAFGYDLNGNLTGDGTWTYTWDAANRLTKASRTGEVWEWTYNGRGQRVAEKLNGVVQWKLRWCGLTLKVMAKPDGSDTRRFFAQGLQRTTVAGGLPTTLAYFTFRDHLGSVREVTNAAGALQKRYAYDPWGRRTETLNAAGSFDPQVGFTGHYFHGATGLHIAHFRAYSAELGRWLNRDPINERDGLNLYGYVGNRITNYKDVFGPSSSEPDPSAGSSGYDPSSGKPGRLAEEMCCIIRACKGSPKCLAIVDAVRTEVPKAAAAYPPGGIRNAMRHCMGACVLGALLPDAASQILECHEKYMPLIMQQQMRIRLLTDITTKLVFSLHSKVVEIVTLNAYRLLTKVN